MKIKEIKLGLIYILSISGQIVIGQLSPLEDCLNRKFDKGDLRLLIDLKEVPLIDSEGLELLWDSHAKFRKAGGIIKLMQPNSLLKDIFHATKTTNIFEIFSNHETAYRSFR